MNQTDSKQSENITLDRRKGPPLRLLGVVLAAMAVVIVGFLARQPSTLHEIHVLRNEGAVSSLALSSDGKFLAGGFRPGLGALDAWTGKVVVWRRDTLAKVAVIPQSSWVNEVAFSEDSALLAVAASTYCRPEFRPDGTSPYPGVSGAVTLWATHDWNQRATLVHPEGIFACQISPNSQLLASLSGHSPDQPGNVMLWDIDTQELADVFPEHQGIVCSAQERWGGCSLRFSPDGDLLAVSEFRPSRGDLVRFWDLEAREIRTELSLKHDAISDLALSPDGQMIALATEMRETNVYDIATGGVRQSFRGTADSQTRAVAFSPDGEVLAIAGAVSRVGTFEPFPPDQWYGVIGLWDLGSGRSMAQTVIREKAAAILTITYSPDGQSIVTGDMGGSIRIWEVPRRL